MFTTKLLAILLIAVNLTGCRWAYEQENLFDGHLGTESERDYATVKRGENPIQKPSYEEYRESIHDQERNATLLP